MRDQRLRVSESLFLDVVRVAAALAVTLGHLTQPYFSTGWRDCTSLAACAVAVFFVLSGFVIRYITTVRRGTLQGYLMDRAARIYSVVIPALVLTLMLDTISSTVNQGYYLRVAGAPLTGHAMWGMVEGVVFTGQMWTRMVVPLSNSPFWSLDYEVIYYLLYGCYFYLTGWRRWVWMGALALLAGPKVLLLLPVWVSGCVAHDLYQRWTASGRAGRYLHRGMAAASVLAVAVGVLAYKDRGFRSVVGGVHGQIKAHMDTPAMGHSNNVVTYLLLAAFGGVLFLWGLMLARGVDVRADGRLARSIRYVSEGTFPLYLLHFPLLLLAGACVPYDHGSALEKAVLFGVVVGLGTVAGGPCNVLKGRIRGWLREAIPEKSAGRV